MLRIIYIFIVWICGEYPHKKFSLNSQHFRPYHWPQIFEKKIDIFCCINVHVFLNTDIVRVYIYQRSLLAWASPHNKNYAAPRTGILLRCQFIDIVYSNKLFIFILIFGEFNWLENSLKGQCHEIFDPRFFSPIDYT
jgi:hypothetical protein